MTLSLLYLCYRTCSRYLFVLYSVQCCWDCTTYTYTTVPACLGMHKRSKINFSYTSLQIQFSFVQSIFNFLCLQVLFSIIIVVTCWWWYGIDQNKVLFIEFWRSMKPAWYYINSRRSYLVIDYVKHFVLAAMHWLDKNMQALAHLIQKNLVHTRYIILPRFTFICTMYFHTIIRLKE